jgi:hypothetical protein
VSSPCSKLEIPAAKRRAHVPVRVVRWRPWTQGDDDVAGGETHDVRRVCDAQEMRAMARGADGDATQQTSTCTAIGAGGRRETSCGAAAVCVSVCALRARGDARNLPLTLPPITFSIIMKIDKRCSMSPHSVKMFIVREATVWSDKQGGGLCVLASRCVCVRVVVGRFVGEMRS